MRARAEQAKPQSACRSAPNNTAIFCEKFTARRTSARKRRSGAARSYQRSSFLDEEGLFKDEARVGEREKNLVSLTCGRLPQESSSFIYFSLTISNLGNRSHPSHLGFSSSGGGDIRHATGVINSRVSYIIGISSYHIAYTYTM